MGIQFRFIYQNNILVADDFDKDILNCTTIREFFDNRIRPYFNLDQSNENYLLYTSMPHEIDDEKMSVLGLVNVIDSNDSNEILVAILDKYDFNEVQNYCDTVLPSLLSTSAQMSKRTIQFTSHINFARGLLMNAINDENASFMLSLIPDDILEKPTVERVSLLLDWFQEQPFTQDDGSIHCYHCETESKMIYCPAYPKVSLQEFQDGAYRTSLFNCKTCGSCIRIPQYPTAELIISHNVHFEDDSVFLFLSMLKAASIDSRIVFMPPSLFCIEFWSEEEKRYIHVDPYQGIIDLPMIYQNGYHMNIQYAIAIGEYECVDVSMRYSENDVSYVNTESYLEIININSFMYKTFTEPHEIQELEKRNKLDASSLQKLERKAIPQEKIDQKKKLRSEYVTE